MSHTAHIPQQFAHLVDLASEAIGGFALATSDDFFAEKENLLKSSEPVWIDGKYTDKGKWMDGWESQRRRSVNYLQGHDWAVIRLGVPGAIQGFLVDTTHFKGNAPEAVSIDAIEADPYLPLATLLDSPNWVEIVPHVGVRPDFRNVVELAETWKSKRFTHVRLRQYPDGGVARLRVYGAALPEARTFYRTGSLDLGAVENGGTIAAVSDQFFGPPSNLLLPGRGVNMGDGWETKRRRTPGSDWCVVKLARRGMLDRIEVDTHFFKGNAPQHVLVEVLDETTIGAEQLESLMRAPAGWTPLVDKHPLEQHRKHQLDPMRRLPVTHVRVHIFPHGGINRMRFFGEALETPEDLEKITALNKLPAAEANTLFLSFCGSKQFAQKMTEQRDFASIRKLFAALEDTFWQLPEVDLLEAFAAHPRLGSSRKGEAQTEQSASWSAGEQSGTRGAAAAVLERLVGLNQAYFDQFGFVFICFATGKSAEEMLHILEERMHASREVEIATAAREQFKITRLRIEKWLSNTSNAAKAT